MPGEVSLLRKEMRKRIEYRKARDQILQEMSTSLNSQISAENLMADVIIPKGRILTPRTFTKAM